MSQSVSPLVEELGGQRSPLPANNMALARQWRATAA